MNATEHVGQAGARDQSAWLAHRLTAAERTAFERDGYLVLPDVVPAEVVDGLEQAFDRVVAEERAVAAETGATGEAGEQKMNVFDFLGRDPRLLEMIDWPATFPKVFDLLGWNIQIYHTHMIVTPGSGPDGELRKRGWHQDSDRLNYEIETKPQPRISLKVAFFLSDCSEPGRGNFCAVPGSHLVDAEVDLEHRDRDPPGATEVLVGRGGAVLFDRRIWHTGTHNRSTAPRKVLFYGYSYRWLRPRDDMQVAHYMDQCGAIRRQLLGASPSGGHGYSSPKPQDVPLRAWMEQHLDAAPAA